MLLTIPTELQTHVLSFLPRRDLASVVRVSHHLGAVAVRLLYRHVELHSLPRVRAFFQISSFPPLGTAVPTRHASAKRAQSELIKTLDITITSADSKKTLGLLPSSLSRPRMARLAVARLRLTYDDDADCLVPLLKCFDPTELGLCRTALELDHRTDGWAGLLGWENVAFVTYARPQFAGNVHTLITTGICPFVPPFSKVTSAAIVLESELWWDGILNYHVRSLVGLCLNLERIEIRVARDEGLRSSLEEMIETQIGTPNPDKLGGQPNSFFSVEDKPDGSSIWGDVEEEDM